MSYRVNKEEIIYPNLPQNEENGAQNTEVKKQPNSVWTEKAPVAADNKTATGAENSASVSEDEQPKTTEDTAIEDANNSSGSKPEEELSEAEKYLKENGLEDEISDIDDLRAYLTRKPDKTDREIALLDSLTKVTQSTIVKDSHEAYIETNAVDTQENAEIANQLKDKTVENVDLKKAYEELLAKDGTNYEKLSRVLDKYLMDNDENYQNIKSADGKRRYRDAQIRELREMLMGNNITQAQRNNLHKDLTALYINAAVKGLSVESLKAEGAARVKNEIIAIKSVKTSILDNINLDDKNKTSNEILFEIADAFVSNSPEGAQYNKLNLEEKQNYLKTRIGELTKKFIFVDIFSDALKKEEKSALADLAISAFRKMKDEGISSDILVNNTTKQQNFINSLLKDNKELLDKVKNPETKNALESMMAKSEIYSLISEGLPNDKKILERDIYNKLKELNDKGELKDEVYKNLYQEYSNMNKLDMELKSEGKYAKGLLDSEANTTSLASISTILGMEPKRYIEVVLSDTKTGKPLEGEELKIGLSQLAKILNANPNSTDISLLKEVLAEKYASLTEKEKYSLLSKAGFEHPTIHRLMLAKGDIGAANLANDINSYGSKEDKITLKNTNKVMASVIKPEKLNKYNAKLNDNAYQDSIDDINAGVRKYYDKTEQVAYRNLSVAKDVPPSRKSKFATSWIASGNANQQMEDQAYFLSLHDAAVTEGVAAAEKFVDASVKEAYSQNLDKEINSGHYSAEQKENFQTARETGQTSYERTQASESTKSETASSNSRATSPSSASVSSSSAENIEGAKVTVSVIYISPESKTYANEIKATLAQLDSENKKAAAMNKIAENIAKIQADAIKYEAKEEQKKINEAKQKAEEIKKENANKSEAQKKEEASKALESSLNEVSESEEAKVILGSINFEEIKKCAQNGQLTQVYNMLSQIPRAQERFLEKLSTQHISTIAHFIKGADKSILKFMCEKNPGILSTLDSSSLMTLCNAGFPKTMIIKYGDKNQVAAMLTGLQMASTKDTLKEFYEVLGLNKDEEDTAEASDVLKKNDNLKPAPGSDEWYAMHSSSTPVKLPMRGKYDKNVRYLG